MDTSHLVILVIGIALGGGMNVLVERITTCLRRRHMTKALLEEVRSLAKTSKRSAKAANNVLIPAVRSGKVMRWSISHFDSPAWDACCKDFSLVSLKELPRLLEIYGKKAFITRLHRGIETQLEHWKEHPSPDPELLIHNLDRLVARCNEFGKHEEIESFDSGRAKRNWLGRICRFLLD